MVLDRGIATEQQVDWLKANGYRYIVVSRERKRRFEPEAALTHRTRSGGVVHLEKVDDAEAGEVRLYCYSEQRAEKERGIAERFAQRLERDLGLLHEGLSRPRTQKRSRRRSGNASVGWWRKAAESANTMTSRWQPTRAANGPWR